MTSSCSRSPLRLLFQVPVFWREVLESVSSLLLFFFFRRFQETTHAVLTPDVCLDLVLVVGGKLPSAFGPSVRSLTSALHKYRSLPPKIRKRSVVESTYGAARGGRHGGPKDGEATPACGDSRTSGRSLDQSRPGPVWVMSTRVPLMATRCSNDSQPKR